MNRVLFNINTNGIIKDIERLSNDRKREAGQHVARAMRSNIGTKAVSLPGNFPGKRGGKLQKSIGYIIDKVTGELIIYAKNWKAKLLEFGWGDGKAKNKRPFFNKTIEQEEDAVITILSRRYW